MADLSPPPAAATSDAQPPAAPSAYEKLAADPSMPKMYPKPVTMLVIGMAGSGKTTLMQVRVPVCCQSAFTRYCTLLTIHLYVYVCMCVCMCVWACVTLL
jgi:hypothetical protein